MGTGRCPMKRTLARLILFIAVFHAPGYAAAQTALRDHSAASDAFWDSVGGSIHWDAPLDAPHELVWAELAIHFRDSAKNSEGLSGIANIWEGLPPEKRLELLKDRGLAGLRWHTTLTRIIDMLDRQLSDADLAYICTNLRSAKSWLHIAAPASASARKWETIVDSAAGLLLQRSRSQSLPVSSDTQRTLELISGAAVLAQNPEDASARFDGRSGAASGEPPAVAANVPGRTEQIAALKRNLMDAAHSSTQPWLDEDWRRALRDDMTARISAGGVAYANMRFSSSIMKEMISRISSDILARMEEKRAELVIVPAPRRIEDMGQFEKMGPCPSSMAMMAIHCPQAATEFERKFRPFVGYADIRERDGSVAAYVEEKGLARPSRGQCKPGRVEVHEWGHMVMDQGLAATDLGKATLLYSDAKAGLHPFIDDYAATNEKEFFAEATEAWFDVWCGGVPVKNSDWIFKNDPPLYTFLFHVYGAPRPIPVSPSIAQRRANP